MHEKSDRTSSSSLGKERGGGGGIQDRASSSNIKRPLLVRCLVLPLDHHDLHHPTRIYPPPSPMLARLNSFVSTPKDSPPPPSADTVDSIEDPLASVASSLASALPTVGRPPLPIPSQLEDLKSQLPIACSSCDSCEDDEEEGEFPELPSKFDMDLETEMLGDIISEFSRTFSVRVELPGRGFCRSSSLVGRVEERKEGKERSSTSSSHDRYQPSFFSLSLDLLDANFHFFFLLTEPMNRLTIIATSKTDWQHEIAETPASLAFHLSQVEKRKAVRPTPSGTSVEPPIEIPGLYDTQEMSKLAVLASSIEVDEEEGKTCARESFVSSSS